jgi:toxin ParE1/3/4
MSARALLSPRARLDLEAIWDHSVQSWGAERAERYFRQLWRHAEELAMQPSLGRSCEEIRDGYRKFHSGSHVLFYRRVEGGIEIIRILHERMDIDRHF